MKLGPVCRVPGAELLSPAYAAGARISTHSWGSAHGEYDGSVANLDEYIYDHPDMLVRRARAAVNNIL